MEWWVAYLMMGVVVGFFAGMLGIGGGVLLVPLMVFLFAAQDFAPDRVLHLALGTSLTSIVFTSLASLRAHHRHGAVRWDIVRRAAPGLVIGTLVGTFVAEALRSRYLAVIFVAFVYYSAAQVFLDIRPEPSRQLPGPVGMWIAAVLVGVMSSLVGAGGGVISIPLMTLCNVPMRNAVGTSAALGLPIAAAGAAGYIFHGLDLDLLPPWSMGYVYLPALVGIVLGTFVTVPLGARAAHRMPVPLLKKIFAVVLFLLASRMLWSLFAA
ncbi:MAG TPA: sulfite exporter TauE/SafE family protein [Burkholderiales bacterium]|nr:sulfite exporter TauE/SafE family protein [Burkholderiales bacterium]